MASQIFYAPDFSLKTQALVRWNNTVLMPVWADADAWKLAGGALVETGVSGAVSGDGFVQGAADGANGAWLLQFDGAFVHYTSGAVLTHVAMPSGAVYTGAAFASGAAFAIDAAGQIRAASGVASGAVSPAYSLSAPPRFLTASGNTLYTLFPAASGLGSFTLSSTGAGVSAVIAAPFDGLASLAASGTNIAVSGWKHVVYGSGYNALAAEPGGLLLLGTRSTHLDVYTGSGSGLWAQTQSISGLGAPQDVTWSPSNVYAFTSDAANNLVRIFTNTLGVLAQTGTLAIANATAAGIMSDSLNGLVAQGSSNQLTGVHFNGSTWATSGTVAAPGPTCVLPTGIATAIVGIASGLAYLTSIAGAWSISASAALPFSPTALALDPFSSLVFACGTGAGSGFVAAVSGTTLASSGSYVGAANGLAYTQGQLALADSVSGVIRTYGVVAGALVAQTGTFAPSGCDAIAQTPGGDIFVAGTSALWQFNYSAPYSLRRARNGQVSIYNTVTSGWVTATFGTSGAPVALTWDLNGNIAVSLAQNALYTVAASGGIVSGAAISQFAGQSNSVPLGISSLLYIGSSLYASTVLNDALLQVQ